MDTPHLGRGRRGAAAALVVAVALVAAALVSGAAGSAVGSEDTLQTGPKGPPGAHTVESDCYEFNESQGTPIAGLPATLTDHYDPVPVATRPDRTLLFFVDYVCQQVVVNGVTSPGQTITTMAIVRVTTRDPEPVDAAYVLWHGTTSGPLHAVMRRLGSDAVALDEASASVTDLGGGRSEVRYDIGDQPVAHFRTAVVSEPPTAPVTDDEPGSFSYRLVGRHGEISIAFTNHLRPPSPQAATNTSRLVVPDTSGIHRWFVTAPQPVDQTRRGISFTRGSWEGAYTLAR